MTNKERLLRILNGNPPDRIPWIPRLKLWYRANQLKGTLPDKWKNKSLREIERDIGTGTPAREGKVFEVKYEGVEIIEREEAGKSISEYHTPKGTSLSVVSDSGLTARARKY